LNLISETVHTDSYVYIDNKNAENLYAV